MTEASRQSTSNITNALCLIIQPLFMNALSILSTAFIIRQLGALQYGQWAVATSLVAIAATMTNPGLRKIFVRTVAQTPDTVGAALSDQITLRFLLAAVFGAGVLVIAVALGYPALIVTATAITLLGMMINTIATTLTDVLHAFQKLKVIAGISLLAGLALTVVSVFAAAKGTGPIGLSIAYLSGPMISLALSGWIAHKSLVRIQLKWRPKNYREILIRSRVMAAELLFVSVHDRVEQLLLPKMAGIPQAGYFAAGTLPADRLIAIPDGLTTAYFPVISRDHGKDDQALLRSVRQLVILSLVTCIPMALLIVFLSPWIDRLLFPGGPSTCHTIMVISIWSLPILGILYPMSCALQGAGRFESISRRNMVSMSLALAMAFVLIYQYGIIGACVAWVARQLIFMLILLPLFLEVYAQVVPNLPFARIAVCAGLMAVALFAAARLPWHGIVAASAGVFVSLVVYVSALLAFKVFGELRLPLRFGRAG